jgi:hypothetical protein
MRALISAYTDPTAALTAQNIGDVYEALSGTFSWFQAICGWDATLVTEACSGNTPCRVCAGLDPLSDAFTTLSKSIRGISGYMRVRRDCPGFGETPSHDPENGTADLVIGFTSHGIDPVFGGTFEACETRIRDVPTRLDGDLSLSFGRSFFLDQIGNLEPIIRFRGSISEQDQEPRDFDLNLRISARNGANFAVAFEVPDEGTMVFFNGSAGRGLQAANGRFSCTFDGPAEQPLACVNVETKESIP